MKIHTFYNTRFSADQKQPIPKPTPNPDSQEKTPSIPATPPDEFDWTEGESTGGH